MVLRRAREVGYSHSLRPPTCSGNTFATNRPAIPRS